MDTNADYSFLAWDVDTTGRRLIDEMCHISAHNKNSTFEQYIMPYRDIDYSSRKRYLLKTVNIGVYRVLRETVEGKILKTKSEVSALRDFIVWLEEMKKADGKNIILMYYETSTPAPFILIESLKKYDLLPRFKETVKGFANAFYFIKSKCEKSMQTYSIKNLAKILLNKDNIKTHDACERAKILYEVVVHLCVGESQDGEDDIAVELKYHIASVEEVEEAIGIMKVTLNKQNSLKPIFGPLIRIDKKRRQAITLRRYLTNANIDYEALCSEWGVKSDVSDFLNDKLKPNISDDELTELSQMINKHFGNGANNGGKENVEKTKPANSLKSNARKSSHRAPYRTFRRVHKKNPEKASNKINNWNNGAKLNDIDIVSENKNNEPDSVNAEENDSVNVDTLTEKTESCRISDISENQKQEP